MKIVHEQILFDCLEQFDAGVSIDALMAKYPQAADEIEKFLTVTTHLQQMRLQPTLAAKQQSQKLFLQQAAQLRVARRQGWFSWRNIQRRLLPLASLAVVTVLLGVTFLFASTSALPGDLLYDTKRWAEAYQLQQATDATAVFNLKSQQNEERVREVKSLLRTNQTAVTSFEGRINTKQGRNWVIAGIPVAITAQTQIDFGAETGALVLVNGRAQNGHFYASQITVLQEASATATPSPTVTSTQTAVPTQTSTASPSATVTATTTETVTPTSTSTIIATTGATNTPTAVSPTSTVSPTATQMTAPEPTATPTDSTQPTAVPPTSTSQPQPTSTPTPGDDNDNDNGNDNDGGDDNDNDNDGDNENDNSGGNDNGNDNDNDNDDDDDDDNDNDDNDNDNDDNDNDGGSSGSGGKNDNDSQDD